MYMYMYMYIILFIHILLYTIHPETMAEYGIYSI